MDDAEETKAMPAVAASSSTGGTAATPPPAQKKRTSPWIWVVVVVLLLLVGAGAAFALGVFPRALSPGQVPNVAGSTVASATQALTVAGFTLGSQETTASAALAKDLVVATDPPAGTQLAKGQTVVLVVSLGPGMVAVPGVVGSTESSALAAIQAAGLTVNVNEAYDAQTQAGLVYKTDPAAGTAVAQQTLVQIFVSTNTQSGSTGTGSGGTGTSGGTGGQSGGTGGTGTQMVTVPDVRGKTFDVAAAALLAKGFKVNTLSQPSSTVPAGDVISQEPPAGSSKPKGIFVTITSSDGAQVTMPNVVGMNRSAAASKLAALGLSPIARAGDGTHDFSLADTVEAQDQTAGEPVDVGEGVTFRYWHLVIVHP